MATSKRYALKFRRRREGRTDYKKRLALLKSREVRVVVRKSNKNTLVQFIQYQPDGDIVLASASTQQLESLGWKAATGNLPAAYLAGFIAAQKAGVSYAIADFGMQHPEFGGRLFAAIQGVIDAGIDVPVSDDALPSEDRLSGAHIDESIAAQIEAVKKKVQ